MAFAKSNENMKAVKRKSYFQRKKLYLKTIRKKIRLRDTLEINKSHPKYSFLQCIRLGMRRILITDTSVKQPEYEVSEKSFHHVSEEKFTSINNIAVQFHAYAPNIFSYLRYMAGINPDDYLEMIAPADEEICYLEFLSNSKSGQNFFLTNNKRLMLKTVTKKEAKFFLSILPEYIGHFSNFPHSLLVKFLGLHSIKVKLLQKTVYFVVMMSIFHPDDRLSLRYDIKACKIGRFTKPANDETDTFLVFKEKNWNDRKLQLGPQKDWFLKQIKIDTEFLEKIGVLDYSLLVGIQSLHMDEVEQNKDLASVILRAKKSFVMKQQLLQSMPSSTHDTRTTMSHVEDESDVSLPGMVEVESSRQICSKTTVVEADTGETQTVCSLAQASPSFSIVSSEHIGPRVSLPGAAQVETRPTASLTSSRFPDLFCRRKVLSEEEVTTQNRRLLPECENELHVIDGKERYFLGIIDFFTRYTFKKKLENAYKRVIYPPLSFSTVPPPVFAARFNKFWEEHTE